MTKFWREGHYRSNYNGTEYWVEGHWVERDDWDRYSYESAQDESAFHLDSLQRLDATSGFSSCYAEPNARCPVCDAPVFFYQNEQGSRVFFDELGPPWPKHPCTDNREFNEERDFSFISFRFREQIAEIRQSLDNLGEDRGFLFEREYGHVPWHLMVVIKRFKVKRRLYIVAARLDVETRRFVYFSTMDTGAAFRRGQIFARCRNKCSYFDLNAMEPRTQNIDVFRRAVDFIFQLPSSK